LFGSLSVTRNNDGGSGAVLELYQNSADPAAADFPGGIDFLGKDSAANVQTYTTIYARIIDATSTNEDSDMQFSTYNDGTGSLQMSIGDGVIIGSTSTYLTGKSGSLRLYDAGDSVAGPELHFSHDDPSADANDTPMRIEVDAGADDEEVAQFLVHMSDPGTGSEDVRFDLNTHAAGANDTRLRVGGDGTDMTSPGTLITSAMVMLDGTTPLRFQETDANGDNFKAFITASSNSADTTCTFENDANFIPDSCVGDGSDASDGRLKDILGAANPDAIGELLDQVQIYDYVWNADSLQSEDVRKGKPGFGPIAQELVKINPDWVTVGGDDAAASPWNWKPEKLVPYLIVEAQSLRKRVTELEGAPGGSSSSCYGVKLGSACIGVSM
jgi:hypothetical protein